MEEGNIIICDGLIYERTDDMSVLSDFNCGIYDMDYFIHHSLQQVVMSSILETYLVKDEQQVLAIFSICDHVLKTKRKNGECIDYDTREIEYLAVRKDKQKNGIGRRIIDLIVSKFMKSKKILSVSAYIDVDTKYTAEPFYAKCGFFRIAGPPHALADHVRMIRFI